MGHHLTNAGPISETLARDLESVGYDVSRLRGPSFNSYTYQDLRHYDKYPAAAQWWPNAGPVSQTVDQYWTNIGS